MRKYNPELINQIGKKIGKPPKYVRERISQRALKHNIAPEAELANWARSMGISADTYIRRLSGSIQAQIYSRPSAKINNSTANTQGLRIIQIGKKENGWYNLWWVQLLIGFFFVGIVGGTISQLLGTILGAYFTNLLGLTIP